MTFKATHYIYILLILFSFDGIFSQDLSLKILSSKKKEAGILKKIDFKKKHNDSTSVFIEINKVSSYLKSIGYFTNTIDSIKKNNTTFTTYFSLNKKIDKAVLKIDSSYIFFNRNSKIKNKTITTSIKELQNTLKKISNNLDLEGKSFSKVQLKNITFIDKTLFGDIDIIESRKREIDKVIIKGYEDFPKSYLKNYFNIKSKTLFNQKKIKETSNASKTLKFVKEIKPPEVLFTKDSTLLYIYLKKQQSNSFDGIINFTSKENGGVLFNGNIDLKLNNTLNTGEKLELFWNSIGEERQEFKLSSEIPYLFNSKLSPQLSFSIYKQDSSFLNTKFESKLFYNINNKTKLAFTYNSESSEDLEDLTSNNLETFSNHFIGIQLQYIIPKNNLFFNNKFNLEINPTLGRRKTRLNSSNQFKIETSISYILDLNFRSSFYIRNKTGYLNSDNYIDNELFRIGGPNSIRGYNVQSIFTSSYTYFNLEYRYLTSKKSYLYSITDIGRIKNKNLTGIGLGYLFTTNKSQINLSTATETNPNQGFNFKNSKITINWKSFF